MPSATTTMHTLKEIQLHKDNNNKDTKQIQKCKKLSLEFWTCLEKKRKVRECGPQYYILSKCVEKLK